MRGQGEIFWAVVWVRGSEERILTLEADSKNAWELAKAMNAQIPDGAAHTYTVRKVERGTRPLN